MSYLRRFEKSFFRMIQQRRRDYLSQEKVSKKESHNEWKYQNIDVDYVNNLIYLYIYCNLLLSKWKKKKKSKAKKETTRGLRT